MSGTTSGTGTGTGTSGAQAQLTRLYDTAFDRAPDAEGLAFWTAALGRGLTLDNIADLLVTTAEFQGRNLSDTEFVRLLYRNGLEREAEPEGENFWVGGLQRRLTDRGDELVDIAESPEGVASALTSGVGTQGTGTGTQTGTGTTGTRTGTQTGTDTTGTDTTGTDTTGTETTGTETTGTDTTGTETTGTETTGTETTGTETTGTETTGTDTTGTDTTGTDTTGTGTGTDATGTETGTQTGTQTSGTTDQQGTDQQDGGGQDTQPSGTQTAAGTTDTGQQTSSTGTGTSLGDDSAFTFVQFRTPDGEVLTVEVVGNTLPVGSEVVNAFDTDTDTDTDANPDAVLVFGEPQQAAQGTAPPDGPLIA